MAHAKNHGLALVDLKLFVKFLIEHQSRCSQINERQCFPQCSVWPDEIELSKHAIVIEDKRDNSTRFRVDSFRSARKKHENQKEDLSPY